jgi:hypothetical protein
LLAHQPPVLTPSNNYWEAQTWVHAGGPFGSKVDTVSLSADGKELVTGSSREVQRGGIVTVYSTRGRACSDDRAPLRISVTMDEYPSETEWFVNVPESKSSWFPGTLLD